MTKAMSLAGKFLIILSLTVLPSSYVFASQEEEAQPSAAPSPAESGVVTDAYRIQVGDELEIKSFYNPELNERVIVRPDGRISLPFAREVQVAGRTPEELSNLLTQRYSAEFKQPEVAVIVRSFGAQKAYVDGQVNRPGMVDLIGPVTVLQAISRAEGTRDTARLSEVVVIRKGPDNRPQIIPVNLKKVVDGSDMSQDIILRPYDIIHVPSSRIANLNRWIDQYIRRNIPIPFSLTYRVNDPDN